MWHWFSGRNLRVETESPCMKASPVKISRLGICSIFLLHAHWDSISSMSRLKIMYVNVPAFPSIDCGILPIHEPYCHLPSFSHCLCPPTPTQSQYYLNFDHSSVKTKSALCPAKCTKRECHLSYPLQRLTLPPRQQSSLPIIFRVITSLLLPPVPDPSAISSCRNAGMTCRGKEGQVGISQEWTLAGLTVCSMF
jgi:hypothetical protein